MQIHGEHRVDQVAENHARRAALLEGGQNRNEADGGAAAALSAAAAEAVAAAVQAVVQAVEAAVEAKEVVVLATGPVAATDRRHRARLDPGGGGGSRLGGGRVGSDLGEADHLRVAGRSCHQ